MAPVDQGWETGKAELPMVEDSRRAPDPSRCFGKYRLQSPQYALAYCVSCPKVKACVRTAWGLEPPHRTAHRGAWWEGSRRAQGRPRPDTPSITDNAAT